MMPTPVEAVRTRRLEIVDEDDVVRIVLYCRRDIDGDIAAVEVYDPKGKLAIRLDNDGEESTVAFWQRGNDVLTVRSSREGWISLEAATPDSGSTALEWCNGEGGDEA